MSASPPRVSVLLPVFNALATLPRAIASLRSQTLPDWELIAVDDGSTDGSAEWLDQAATGDRRIRVLSCRHGGIVSALNTGLASCQGACIARMDADDECLPTRLARQLDFLDQHADLGLVGSRVEYAGDASANAGYAAHVDWLNSVETPADIEQSRFIESPFAHPSVVFRRDLPERHGAYRSGDFPEDYDLWLRWLESGVRMAKVPEVLLRWQDPPGRLSRIDARYDAEAFFRLKAPFLARWLRRHVAPGREILVWGAGRLTRRRVDHLRAEGISIRRFIDIDLRKVGLHGDGREVLPPESIPEPSRAFVVGYVANRGARNLQRRHLTDRGWVEGRDFLFAA